MPMNQIAQMILPASAFACSLAFILAIVVNH